MTAAGWILLYILEDEFFKDYFYHLRIFKKFFYYAFLIMIYYEKNKGAQIIPKRYFWSTRLSME